MDFSVIKNSIHDAWDFLWPPIVLLVLLITIAAYVAPTRSANIRARLSQLSDPAKAKRLRSYLRLWGLGKLIPLVAAISVIFALYVTDQLVRTVGQLLPPRISYRHHVLVLKHADPRLMYFFTAPKVTAGVTGPVAAQVELFQIEPSEAAIVTAQRIVDLSLNDESVRQWREESGAMHRRYSAAKFLIAWLVGCALAERMHGGSFRFSRILLWTFVLGIAALGYAVSYLYSVDQLCLSELSSVQAGLNRDLMGVPSTHGYREFLLRVEAQRGHERWWVLGTGKTEDHVRWIYQEFLRGGA